MPIYQNWKRVLKKSAVEILALYPIPNTVDSFWSYVTHSIMKQAIVFCLLFLLFSPVASFLSLFFISFPLRSFCNSLSLILMCLFLFFCLPFPLFHSPDSFPTTRRFQQTLEWTRPTIHLP